MLPQRFLLLLKLVEGGCGAPAIVLRLLSKKPKQAVEVGRVFFLPFLLLQSREEQSGVSKSYLLSAFENKDQCVSYLDMSLGTLVPSIDIRNCELLTDSRIFREEIKVTRDGRNRYKTFYLTSLGMEMAKQLNEESMSGEMPQSL